MEQKIKHAQNTCELQILSSTEHHEEAHGTDTGEDSEIGRCGSVPPTPYVPAGRRHLSQRNTRKMTGKFQKEEIASTGTEPGKGRWSRRHWNSSSPTVRPLSVGHDSRSLPLF